MKSKLILSTVITIVMVFLLPVMVAFAPTQEAPAEPVTFEGLCQELAGLGGFAAVFALIVNIGKVVKINGNPIVKDGAAPIWITGMNVAALFALYFMKLYSPNVDIGAIDTMGSKIAEIGVMILTLVLQIGVSQFTHARFKNVPLIGKSYSSAE